MTDDATASVGSDVPLDTKPDARSEPGLLALALGSLGVVYGDIGTSPLYAFREAILAAAGEHKQALRAGEAELARGNVLGVLSLILWALIVVVTLKYVVILLRADNNGEGGTLTLMALASRAVGRVGKAAGLVALLGIVSAALFYGDAVITPALSVLSAIEGLDVATPAFHPYVLPITVVILLALFAIQARGTASVASLFGPITALWFLAIAIPGLLWILHDPVVLWALSPHMGIHFLLHHGMISLYTLGAVFLAVTGAEALYADLGHFGRRPIQTRLAGCGAALAGAELFGAGRAGAGTPGRDGKPVLSALSGRAAPSNGGARGRRYRDCQPSRYHWRLFADQPGHPTRAVTAAGGSTHVRAAGGADLHAARHDPAAGRRALLVALFRSSSALASAYGIAVTGTMVVTGIMAFIVFWRLWHWSLLAAAALIFPFIFIDLTFLSANMLKVVEGGWVPLALGGSADAGHVHVAARHEDPVRKTRRLETPLEDLVRILERKPPQRVPGTAVFLTSDPTSAPTALMHSLKHYKVLHENNVILSVETTHTPRVDASKRVRIEPVGSSFLRVLLRFGYMESPNVPRALAIARKLGWQFDIMSTSFFLSRRALRPAPHSGMPRWQDRLFIRLARSANDATDYFNIPTDRVVEVGTQVTV